MWHEGGKTQAFLFGLRRFSNLSMALQDVSADQAGLTNIKCFWGVSWKWLCNLYWTFCSCICIWKCCDYILDLVYSILWFLVNPCSQGVFSFYTTTDHFPKHTDLFVENQPVSGCPDDQGVHQRVHHNKHHVRFCLRLSFSCEVTSVDLYEKSAGVVQILHPKVNQNFQCFFGTSPLCVTIKPLSRTQLLFNYLLFY